MSKSTSNEPLSLDKLLKTYLETKDTLGPDNSAELEIKFGTRKIKRITKNGFDNVIQQLLSKNFKFEEQSKYYLSIKADDIRTEIHDLKNIQKYCQTNNLPSDYHTEGYNFNEKRHYKIGEDKTPGQFNVDNFNFRVAYSVETNLLSTSEPVKALIENWSSSKKFYRLINRFTMTHEAFPFKIDLSIVRDSLNEKQNFKESNILQLNGKYEIEIEVLNEKISKDETSANLDKMLKTVTKYILSGLQGTNYPVAYNEQQTIIQDYLQLIRGPTYTGSDEATPKDFIGPSSTTLQIVNVAPVNKDANVVSIRSNYTVTDKADGDRKMIYISKTGKIYLITTLLSIEFTGAKTDNKKIFNTLLDGEHIKHNKTGQFINLYAAFDIYYMGGKDIRELVFTSSASKPELGTETDKVDKTEKVAKSRWDILRYVIQNMEAFLINTKELPPIRIEKKRFYETSKDQSIFAACNKINEQINSGQYEYQTDGFIFTPTNFGVGLTKQGQRPKSYKHTWDYSLKWKPAEFNTIDFLITTKKLQTGAEYVGNKFEGGLDTSTLDQIVQYKTIILRVGYDVRKHGYVNPCQNIINDDYPKRSDADNEDRYKPVQFFPSNPYDPNAGVTNIELRLDNTNDKQMFTEEDEIIEDNTIVECRYDITKPEGWRWIPLRIRYDKTAEYKAGFKNYGNAYHVAQSNWHSIHNPITLDMMTTGKDIPNELENDDIYYNQGKGGTKITKGLRDFHNLFVKSKLVNSTTSAGDTLIDYAVGKGGDLPKWISAKLSFIFGIDLSKDNIQNKLDGVCARYLNYKRDFDTVPDALFIYGNTGKNIKNTQAAFTEKGRQIINSVFGIGQKDEKILGAGVAKSFGRAADGFNVSSIQFALHYMFENAETLHNFMMNIAECTKLDGYFIGTSYNGKRVYELLENKKQGEAYTFFDRDEKNKLLEITKQYDREGFEDNMSCLGYGIDVYQASINKTFREYLVNYDYLTSILETYGFVPLTVDEAKKIGLTSSVGDFEQLYKLMLTDIKDRKLDQTTIGMAYKMTREEKNISFLNNYFIFKKVRNVDVQDIKVGLATKSKQELDFEALESLKASKAVAEVLEQDKSTTKSITVKKTKKLVLKPSKQ